MKRKTTACLPADSIGEKSRSKSLPIHKRDPADKEALPAIVFISCMQLSVSSVQICRACKFWESNNARMPTTVFLWFFKNIYVIRHAVTQYCIQWLLLLNNLKKKKSFKTLRNTVWNTLTSEYSKSQVRAIKANF